MQISKSLLTKTPQNNEVWLYTVGAVKLPKVVLIGGVHGDEPEGATLVEDLIAKASEDSNLVNSFKACVLALPRFNPDGLSKMERTNGNGVDLNRNFPSKDWSAQAKAPRYFPGAAPASEPEVRALLELLQKNRPFLVIHCHTYIPQICYTGDASKPWAEILAKNFTHPITDDIGYPTPGSLGQYCLYNLHTPCVCIELPEQVERQTAWQMVGDSLIEIARRGP